MRFGPKRAHVMFIFEHFIKDFGLFLLAVIMFLFVRDVQILLDNAFLVAVALFGPAARLIKFIFTRYSISDEALLIESGWLKKQRQEVPLEKISTVDFTQNLLFQAAGVYTVQVETAAGIGSVEDGAVRMVLGKADALCVKDILLKKESGAEPEALGSDGMPAIKPAADTGKTIRASAGELMAMCFLQIKWIIVAIQIGVYLLFIIGFADQYIMSGDRSSAEMLFDLAAGFAPLVLLWILIALYIISVMISALAGMVKYYNFRVTDRGDSLFIEYGLLTRKTHTIMKEKISGISFRQSLIMRIMKAGTLQVFVAGYGGIEDADQEETVLLYPMIKEARISSFVNEILAEDVNSCNYEKAPVRGLPYFFLCGRFIVSILLMVILCLVPLGESLHTAAVVLGAVIVLLAAGSVVMEQRLSAIAVNDSMVTMCYGGYTKNTVMLKQDKIEFAGESASEIKRKKRNLCSINVGVLAPMGVSAHKVRNMELEVFDSVKDKLTY